MFFFFSFEIIFFLHCKKENQMCFYLIPSLKDKNKNKKHGKKISR